MRKIRPSKVEGNIMKKSEVINPKFVDDSLVLSLLHRLKSLSARMSDWEREFCYDTTHVMEMGGHCSMKQYLKLKSLEVKYFGS